ncbi:MAG TPA: hypothetical protein VIK49_06610 [Steroidobacteraceae bacterium]
MTRILRRGDDAAVTVARVRFDQEVVRAFDPRDVEPVDADGPETVGLERKLAVLEFEDLAIGCGGAGRSASTRS